MCTPRKGDGSVTAESIGPVNLFSVGELCLSRRPMMNFPWPQDRVSAVACGSSD